MPHCIIEYSKDLASLFKPQALVMAVHKDVVNSALFEASSIKSRAIGFEYYYAGLPDTAFIHVGIKIFPEKSEAQRHALSHAVLNAVLALPLQACSVSVEIFDIEKASYALTVV